MWVSFRHTVCWLWCWQGAPLTAPQSHVGSPSCLRSLLRWRSKNQRSFSCQALSASCKTFVSLQWIFWFCFLHPTSFFFFLISCSKLFFIYLYHHSFISLNGGNPLKLFQRFREEWLAGKHCVAAASIIPFAHQFPFSLDLNEMQAHNVARLFCDHTLLLHLCKQSTLWGST